MARHYSMNPYCVACRLRLAMCVCASAPRLDLPTRVILVIHASEWGRSSNTGHLARLAFRNAEVRIHGRRHRFVSNESAYSAAASTFVLYPGRGDTPLTPSLLRSFPQPATLFVPDGNWNQAKAMMARLPMLRNARSVHLDTPALSISGLRRNSFVERRSTFEALAQAMGILEGMPIERRLLEFFEAYRGGKRGT